MLLAWKLKLLVIVLIVCSTINYSSASIPELPNLPSAHVVDLAGIINDDVEAKLNGYLFELEQKTTAQFVVLTINSLDGKSLEDFSFKVAHEKWKLGQKGKDNGTLLLVSLQDRKYRFEIGYGLESILPDSLVGSIGRMYLVPYFKQGDYSTGIFKTSLVVINEITSKSGVEITGMPKLSAPATPKDNVQPLEHKNWWDMGKNILLLLVLAILCFIGFVIYFNFKILQFVLTATNLYNKMVGREDTMNKLLIDIRDNTKQFN
jgi:uncharacterized protein